MNTPAPTPAIAIHPAKVSALPHQRFFYGWVIAIIAAIGLASCVAIFIPSTIGLLVGPLKAEFGWSPKAIFLAPVFATTTTIVIAPFIGSLVDRYGARRVIALSFAAEALLIASFHQLDGSIGWLYARYAAFALLGTGGCHVAFTALISKWFDRRRGLALGIALAGFGLGGVFWSLVTQALFDRYGWRDAFLVLGAIVGFVTLPIMLLLVRESPRALGLEVDGGAPAAADAKPLVRTGMTLRQAAATRHYWLMLLAFGLVGCGVQSIMLHIVPFMKSRGESAQTAAAFQASLWAVLVVGRVSTGWLLDRFFAPRVAFVFLLLPIAGIALLAGGATGAVALVAAMMVGLAAGAEVDVVAYLCSRYFGLLHYALIYSTFFAAYAVGSGAGPALTAWAVEVLGGYRVVFAAVAGVLAVAGLLLLTFPRYEKGPAH
ncbi:MAG: MFS transporter [Burkholderiales bacterium]|nr:MFS transporter [Burkholderiales bacterium]